VKGKRLTCALELELGPFAVLQANYSIEVVCTCVANVALVFNFCVDFVARLVVYLNIWKRVGQCGWIVTKHLNKTIFKNKNEKYLQRIEDKNKNFTFFHANWTYTGPPSIAFANSYLIANQTISGIAFVDQLTAKIVVRVVGHDTVLEIVYFGASSG
jgi:hypothetical protein